MTDPSLLESLRAPAPRDEQLCRRLAAGIDPAWGFVVYGVLWMWIGLSLAFGAAAGFVLLLLRIVGDKRMNGTWWLGPAVAIFVAGCVLVVWSFVRWVRGRRGRARALFRDGRLVDGEIERLDHIYLRGSQITRIKVAATVDGKRGHAVASAGGHLAVSGAVPVLVLPGYRYCATFLNGVMCPAAWHG